MACLINQRCTNRFVSGRTGYALAPAIVAVVLHQLGFDAASYDALLQTPLPPWGISYPTSYPKSVHFVIDDNGNISQYIPITSTAFGIDNFFETFYPVPPTTSVNAPWLHIGYTGSTVTEAQNLATQSLLCCLSLDNPAVMPSILTSTVITAWDLDANRSALTEVPLPIVGGAVSCIVNGGFPEPVDVTDLEDRIILLEECCEETRADILDLQARVVSLELWRPVVDGRLNALEAWRLVAEGQLAIIPTLVAQIQAILLVLAEHQECIDIVCPDPVEEACVQYRLSDMAHRMLVTPNQPVWVNFPLKISDREPPLVITGPLWNISLPVGCSWLIEATVRFDLSKWCAGKKVWMDLHVCGNVYRIAEFTIPVQGMSAPTVSGSFLLTTPPACNDVHIHVGSNDEETMAKYIVYGDFKACCIN